MPLLKSLMKLYKKVEKIIFEVKKYGDSAVRKYTKIFDGVILENFKVELKEVSADRKFERMFLYMVERVKSFHQKQFKAIKDFEYEDDAVIIKVKHHPVESVCIYVPGGRFFYPSTLVMTAIPARCAGVKKIFVTTPPKMAEKLIYPVKKLGLDGLYSIGGVQAIAAFAFGTETIPKVDLIAGPGNEYVNTAKKIIFGYSGIDTLAGPSEAIVILEEENKLKKAIYEVKAQLEHSPDARGYIFTTNRKLSGKHKFVKYFKSKEALIDEVNRIAPEHLFIISKGYENIDFYAGCVVYNGSVVFTDYFAGSSHTLPTAGAARFLSGLSVWSFLRRTNYVRFKKKCYRKAINLSSYFSRFEGLRYHNIASRNPV